MKPQLTAMRRVFNVEVIYYKNIEMFATDLLEHQCYESKFTTLLLHFVKVLLSDVSCYKGATI